MAVYGITPQGFVGKDFETIKGELEALFKASFGDDLDVSSTSVAGQLIGNLSLKFLNIWELIAAIYASFDPDTASDASLDRVSAMVNVLRLLATATEVIVALYGEQDAVIPQNHLVGQATGTSFRLTTATTITREAAVDITVEIPVDPTPTEVFEITIDSTEFTYTAQVEDTKLEILGIFKGMIDAIPALNLNTVVDSEQVTLRIYVQDGKTPFLFLPTANFNITILATPGRYLAQTLGRIAVPANTVNINLQAVSGLDSVNNMAEGTLGRDRENDTEFRTRRRSSLFSNGSATDEAIRSRLLQEVVDVSYVRVYSNREDAVDSEGRPGHSTEVVVMGGDDMAIANKLWQVWPSGTGFHGNTTIVIKDSVGDDQTIKYSRPVSKYIWVQVQLTLSSEEDFPAGGTGTVKTNIVNWALENLNPGINVIFQKLYQPIYKVAGIEEANVLIGVSDDPETPPGTYGTANIPISPSQLALFDISRIEVTIL
jgi:uncharacterized phage protein gp47/JayE